MKIRNDFVTNSSSSSFILTIGIETKRGDIEFIANGGSPESGRIDFFDNDAIVTISPKQLGTAENVEEFIRLLTDGVVDGAEWYEEPGVKIFAEDAPISVPTYDCDGDFDYDNPNLKEINAYDFIREIRNKVISMDDIIRIRITGEEINYMCYNQEYEYNRETGEYTGYVRGCEFEKDGATGGEINLTDLDECEIEYEDEDGWYQ